MDPAAIEVKGLTKHFSTRLRSKRQVGAFVAVDHLDLSVARGESVAIIGANGAGKSTLIRLLTGINRPSSGSVRLFGKDPIRNRSECMRMFGLVTGAQSQLWLDLTLRDSLHIIGRFYGLRKDVVRQRITELSEQLENSHTLDRQARKLSLGERVKGDLIATLLRSPDILFLDEPTVGLDLRSKEVLRTEILRATSAAGSTVILTSHEPADIEAVSDRVVMMQKGRVSFDGSLGDFRSSSRGHSELRYSGPNHLVRAMLKAHEDVSVLRETAYEVVLKLDEGCHVESLTEIFREAGNLQDFQLLQPSLADAIATRLR